jgi:hypothetical protein
VVVAILKSPKGELHCNDTHVSATDPEGAQLTVGADKDYDVKEFVDDLETHNIKPRIALNITPHRGSAITDEIAAERGYEISLRICKRIEQVFG